MPREVYLKDIARKVGVSPATVTRTLRKTSGELTARQREIIRLAKEAGCDQAFYGERHRELGPIALITAGLPWDSLDEPTSQPSQFGYTTGDFYSRCIHGVERGVRQFRGHVGLFNFRKGPRLVEQVRQAVQGINATGMVLFLAGGSRNPTLRAELRAICPAVQVNAPLDCGEMDAVAADYLGGYRLAMQRLIELGHRRIGCWTNAPASLAHRCCETVYRARVDAERLDYCRVSYIDDSGRDVFAADLERAFRAHLDDSERPTAILCCSDMLALALLRLAANHGLRIPEDLSVIGLDNVGAGAHSNPALTTVDCDLAEMGRQAVGLLHRRLLSPSEPWQRVSISARLVTRESDAAP